METSSITLIRGASPVWCTSGRLRPWPEWKLIGKVFGDQDILDSIFEPNRVLPFNGEDLVIDGVTFPDVVHSIRWDLPQVIERDEIEARANCKRTRLTAFPPTP